LCATFDEDGICYSGGYNGSVHCWDQRGELGIVLKAHAAECTAIVCSEGILISTGKDFKITVHTAIKGKFEYVRQINLVHSHCASSIDYMGGKILIGHDNGRICTTDIEGKEIITHNISHCDGEAWGLEIIPNQGTFLTCGDDNQFLEISIRDKKVLRSGKIWTKEQNGDKAYETKKIKSTASTLSEIPAY
jgi:WD40 repeat protein